MDASVVTDTSSGRILSVGARAPGRLAGHSSKIGERRAYFFFFFFKEIFVTRVAAPVDLAAVDLAAGLGVTFLFATIIHLPVEFRAPKGTYPKTYAQTPTRRPEGVCRPSPEDT